MVGRQAPMSGDKTYVFTRSEYPIAKRSGTCEKVV